MKEAPIPQGSDTIKELALLTLSTLEQSFGYFVDAKLRPLSDNTIVKVPVRQAIHDVKFDYFMKT